MLDVLVAGWLSFPGLQPSSHLRDCFKTPHWAAKRGFCRHSTPIFNSVALLCSEK